MSTATVKNIFKDMGTWEEFKRKIKNKGQVLIVCNGWKTDCAEIYCPAEIMGLRPAWALELTTIDPEDGILWDFTKEDTRQVQCEAVGH